VQLSSPGSEGGGARNISLTAFLTICDAPSAAFALLSRKAETPINAPGKPKANGPLYEEPLADSLNSTFKKRLRASLYEVFGIDSLRPVQEAVIRNVLRRVDTLRYHCHRRR
jgi:hypothetical protein